MRDPRTTSHVGRAALQAVTRRHFFRRVGDSASARWRSPRSSTSGCSPARRRAGRGADPLAARPPHFAPKAKRVIYLFMAGAPSQLDLFDPKPKLQQHDGQPIPEELVKGERFAFIKGTPRLLGSPYAFEKVRAVGRRGLGACCPHFRTIVDEVAVVRSVHTTQFNHAPAQIFMNTGHQIVGPAVDGRVGDLRPRQREPRPARLRRARLGRERPRRRQELLGQRLPADRLPGRRVPQRGRARPLPGRPAGRRPRGPARLARRAARPQRARASTRPATPRSRRASPPTRWPTACRRACPS